MWKYVVLLSFLIFPACASAPVLNGEQVVIDSGSHHIEGTLQSSSSYQYLMKDEGVSVGTFAGDAFITLFPLAKADKLKAKYGDFFRCDDQGAKQAIRQLETAILVGDDADTQWAIAKALGLVRQSRIPSVSFDASMLNVKEHIYMGMEVRDNMGIPIYYVTEFTILQEDYMEGIK